jgi:ribokinase
MMPDGPQVKPDEGPPRFAARRNLPVASHSEQRQSWHARHRGGKRANGGATAMSDAAEKHGTTAPTVLTVGSLHYDIMVETGHLPQRDETAVGTRWYPKFGGKGGNQAVAVAKAGVQSRMSGAVGNDDFGRFLRNGLRAAGVDETHVATLAETGSGMSVAITDAAGDYAATIVSGANLLLDPASLAQDALWQGVGLLILQNEIPPEVNLAASRQARARGVQVLLNAAPARSLSPDLVALTGLLVVNAVEAEMMGTGPVRSLTNAMAAAQHLAGQFASVIVTAGANGLAGAGADAQAFSLPAEKVPVVSSHGAGDAFVGALAAALVRGQKLPHAARQASLAAARHVARQA